ncbi:hypothetical protein J1N35_014410 [Gossypium stocksii]|uniref:Reverse transcriptase domain-containing protein n=1 Tax=Gossypium stocksii TaxID=47602 RepID=A0A9D4A9B7_9ROSI|nr:hypothetical protein J1N35_014410 [Gossypium stocksii]
MDQEQLKLEEVNFFTSLYGELPDSMSDLPIGIFPHISDKDFNFLNTPISNEEIKSTLFDIVPLKAPGSDRYHALFYQSQWDHVGTSVCRWVKGIFDDESIDPDLNNSLLFLIPKIQNLKGFAHFWPISLCYVLYKLVMKVIANRFKKVFCNLIAPEQTSF